MLNSFFHAVLALTKGSRANLHLGNQYYSHLASCILKAQKASIIQALLQDNTLKYIQQSIKKCLATFKTFCQNKKCSLTIICRILHDHFIFEIY